MKRRLLLWTGALSIVAVLVAATPHQIDNESYVDPATGLIWHVNYDPDIPHTWTLNTPLKQGAVLTDLSDDKADITTDGALSVRDQGIGYPAAAGDATGQDTYASILTVTHQCTHLLVTVATQPAMLSFNGTTNHIYVPAGTYVLDGLNIAAATSIRAKNAGAGNNYATLYITAW